MRTFCRLVAEINEPLMAAKAPKTWIAIPGKGPHMKSSRAILLAAFAIIAASHAASAQAPSQCNAFIPLRDDAQQKAAAVRAATEHKAERKEVCALVTRFATAEAAVVKFLDANKTWCGIPDEAVKAAARLCTAIVALHSPSRPLKTRTRLPDFSRRTVPR